MKVLFSIFVLFLVANGEVHEHNDQMKITGSDAVYIHTEQLKNLANIRSLTIEHTNLFTIDQTFMDKFPYLEKLKIIGDNNLEDDALQNLKYLRKLSLENANIEYILENYFKGLTSLENLEIINSGVRRIHPDAFNDLASLEELKLNHNKLRYFSGEVFQPLVSLKELELEYNEIESLVGIVNSNVEKIKLNYNRIKPMQYREADRIIMNLPNLKKLYLKHNQDDDVYYSLGFSKLKQWVDVKN